MLLMNRVADVIVAACCLHNFLIQFGEGVEIQDEEQFPADDEVDEDENDADNDANEGIARRQNITNLLNQ